MSSYDHNNYPRLIYERAKRSFSSLKSNESEISYALNWKYGNIGKANYLGALERIIKKVANSWPQFVGSTAIKSPEDTFDWWKSRLLKGLSSRFVTIAFITYLVHHKKLVPIIDQHNF